MRVAVGTNRPIHSVVSLTPSRYRAIHVGWPHEVRYNSSTVCVRSIESPYDFRSGETARLEATCVEQVLNGSVRYASGEDASWSTRRWNRVVSVRVGLPVAVRAAACTVGSERNRPRFRSNAASSISRTGCKPSIRRCTRGTWPTSWSDGARPTRITPVARTVR
jgi:hypothetical protein